MISLADKKLPVSSTEMAIGYLRDMFALIFIGTRSRPDNNIAYRLQTIWIEIQKRILYR